MWTNHSWMGGMWYFPVIMAVIVILIIIFFGRGRYALPWDRQNDSLNKQNDTAVDILKKRYANGEISKEEYESIKNGIQ